MKNTRLIMGREIEMRLKSKTFVITTVVVMILLALASFAPKIISDLGGFSAGKVAVTGEALSSLVESGSSGVFQVETVADADAARTAVVDGDAVAALAQQSDGSFQIYVSTSSTTAQAAQPILTQIVQQAAMQNELVSQGVDLTAVNQAVTAATPQVEQIGSGGIDLTLVIIAFVISLMLYMQIIIYGQMVSTGVVEEKSSRIVEILLATVSSRQLLVGKVLGIGIVSFIQFALFIVVGLISALSSGLISMDATTIGVILSAIAWFVPGYLVYAFGFAATGSMASKPEDAAQTATPVMILAVAPYIIAVFAMQNISAGWISVVSTIPPFSAIMMPMLATAGVIPLWQLLLAYGLLILAVIGMILLAARIYQNSVLKLGSKQKLLESIRGNAG